MEVDVARRQGLRFVQHHARLLVKHIAVDVQVDVPRGQCFNGLCPDSQQAACNDGVHFAVTVGQKRAAFTFEPFRRGQVTVEHHGMRCLLALVEGKPPTDGLIDVNGTVGFFVQFDQFVPQAKRPAIDGPSLKCHTKGMSPRRFST